MTNIAQVDYSLFKKRREQILNFLKEEYPSMQKGLVILFADFENERHRFRQESSFYYLTGINEPGCILFLYLDGRQVLYIPNYGGVRGKWTTSCLITDDQTAKKVGVTQIKYLGLACGGYSFSSVFSKENYQELLIDLDTLVSDRPKNEEPVTVFTILDNMSPRYSTQVQLYRILLDFFPSFSDSTKDLAPLVHYLRRIKSEYEIDQIYKAVQITNMAHESACRSIEAGRFEYEIQGLIESIFIQAGGMGCAFPSIVATGKNTTVLHYTKRDEELKLGDMVVIDIGAEYGFYAADLTRTYPVGGKFSKRQLEVYNTVLETQTYIESVAKPGMFLNNPDQPEKSLNHLAIKFLQDKGFGKYIAHGIGHFLGLDVHDVGDTNRELDSGDVFTIEPGVYIPEENLGVRIEDDYLMTDEGVVCLSYQLPRRAQDIEKMMEDEEF